MKKILLALCLLLVAGVAYADVFVLFPGSTITVPTCASGGGTSTTLTAGYYEVHVDTGTVAVCYAATCASGGMTRVVGNHGATYIAADTSVSCRSAASGVVQFVPASWKR